MGELNCRVLFPAGYVITVCLQTSVLALLHPLSRFCASEASRVSEAGSALSARTGCPRRRMVGRGGLTHCHLPNACSLRSTKPEYHLFHALLSNLPDRLAFGGIASVQCGKEGTSLTGGMRDWGRGLLPLPLHDHPSVQCPFRARTAWLCFSKLQSLHL